MTRFFISYSRSDRDRIRPLLDALERDGHDYFLDVLDIESGADFRARILHAISQADKVITVWSRVSSISRYVLDEANVALRQNKFCAVRIDDTDIPIGFGMFNTIDLYERGPEDLDPPGDGEAPYPFSQDQYRLFIRGVLSGDEPKESIGRDSGFRHAPPSPTTTEEIPKLGTYDEILDTISAEGVWIPEASPLSKEIRRRITQTDFRDDISGFPGPDILEVVENTEDWEGARIAASDLVPFLRDRKRTSGRLTRGMTLAGLNIVGDINLREVQLEAPLRLLGCQIEGRIYLDFSQMQTLDIRACTIDRLDARGVTVTGDVILSDVTVKSGVFLDDAVIKGRVRIVRSSVSKGVSNAIIYERLVLETHRDAIAISLSGSTIDDGVSIDTVKAYGAIVLDNAEIGASLALEETVVDGKRSIETSVYYGTGQGEAASRGFAFKAMNARVDGTIDFSNCVFHGEVRMLSLEARGSLYFDTVLIMGANGRSLLLDFASIGEDLRLRGFEATGCIRMRKARVGGDLMLSHNEAGGIERQPFRVETQVLTDERREPIDAYDRIKGFALRLSGARVEGDFRVIGTNTKPAEILGTMDLNNIHVGRKLRMEACDVKCRLERTAIFGPFLTVGGDIRWSGVHLEGTTDFQDATVNGTFEILPYPGREGERMRKFDAHGDGREALLLRRMQIGGDLRIDGTEVPDAGDDGARFRIVGPTILTAAKIGGELTLARGICAVSAEDASVSDHMGVAVGARAVVVQRGIFIERDFRALGEVRLIEAEVNGDVRIAKVRMNIDARHVKDHPHALRMDRMRIDGSLSFGGKGGERDPERFDVRGRFGKSADGADGPPEPSAPRFICRGPMSLSGLQVSGYVSFMSMRITSLWVESKGPTPIDYKMIERFGTDVQCTAVEANFMSVGRALYFGNRAGASVTCHGCLDFSGSRINGDAIFNQLLAFDGAPPNPRHKGVFVAEHMRVGSNFDVRNSILLGGMILTQIEISGSAHIEHSLLAAADLTAPREGPWRDGDHLLTDIDPRQAGLSFLQSRFGRSLKLRESTRIYGALELTAARIGNDIEVWLKTFRPPQNLRPDVNAHLTAWSAVLNLGSIEVPPSTFDGPDHASLFWGKRARVDGVFYLGHSADTANAASDENHGGVMNFTNLSVGTVNDSRRSWPDQGKLTMDGFRYDRFERSPNVPLDPDSRIRWIKRCRRHTAFMEVSDFAPDLMYDQLYTAYIRMSLPRYAERVAFQKVYYQTFNRMWGGQQAADIHRQTRETESRRWLSLPAWLANPASQALSRAMSWTIIPLRLIFWLLYGRATYCGYRPWRFTFVMVPWFLLGAALHAGAINGGPPAAAGEDWRARSCLTLGQLRAPEGRQGIALARRLPKPDPYLFTLDSMIPLDLGVTRFWRITTHASDADGSGAADPTCRYASLRADSLIGAASPSLTLDLPISYRTVHVLYRLISYVLVAILIVASLGLLKPVIRPPEPVDDSA
ncbi:MAG: toll/interleukin-1 receptor domain-containing protein [Alphaproteobacteria bacterium]